MSENYKKLDLNCESFDLRPNWDTLLSGASGPCGYLFCPAILCLTKGQHKVKMLSLSRTYSTKEAAKKVGVHWMTLHKWLAACKIRPSAQINMNGGKHWRWTAKDMSKIKKYKEGHFREGQGRR